MLMMMNAEHKIVYSYHIFCNLYGVTNINWRTLETELMNNNLLYPNQWPMNANE